MGAVAKLREVRWRTAGHFGRPLSEVFIAPLFAGRLLEIGGPSAVFRGSGLARVYPRAASVDGVQWAEETVWHGRQRDAYVPDGASTGVVHVMDGGRLEGLADDSYDGVISSHVIEHLANPLRALEAWRRVTRPGGALLLVAPHKAGTFDHRRPTTPLAHMLDDYEGDTGEDDLTHLEETLRLHDRRRDGEGGSYDAWAARRRDNARHRVLHHHVFTTASLVELVAQSGVMVTAIETRFPHDIYVAGTFVHDGAILNRELLNDALRRSPFRSDRVDARQPSASAMGGAR